ncbi:MAG: pseudouridine synthase [Candidatus Izimaplasma sp.]|nr:pseudouridine synthase [Candidatus Izimaplasma bacterium]
MRIDKLLSNLHYGSRKEIKKAIKDEHVNVNETIVTTPKLKVDPSKDRIEFYGKEVFYKADVLLMLNKPKGYVSSKEDPYHKTIYELLDEKYKRLDLKIAGRLDVDTEGLLLLTNSGQLIHSIISPNKDVYKQYYVEVARPFEAKKLLKKMTIKDSRDRDFIPKTPKVKQLTDTSFQLEIKEGKYHQIKRMVAYYDNEVTYLKRLKVGALKLDESLDIGDYKEVKKNNVLN